MNQVPKAFHSYDIEGRTKQKTYFEKYDSRRHFCDIIKNDLVR